MCVTATPISSMWPISASVGAPSLARADARERGAERVAVHLGERGGGVAPDGGGRLLVPRGARGEQEVAEEVRNRHGLRIQAGVLSWVPDDPPRARAGGPGARAGRERAPDRARQPSPLHPKTPHRVFFLLRRGDRRERHDRDHPHRSSHPARGVPPAARERRGELPARVRRPGAARALLARRLRVAAPRRPRGARRSDEPVVGHVGYDWITELEPTVPLPDAGIGAAGEPLRRRRRAPALRPRARRLGGAARRAGRDRGAPRGERRAAGCELRPPVGRRLRRFPDRATHEAGVEPLQGAHPRRRRVPDRAVAARRAADVGDGARDLPRPAADQPVAVHVPARARGVRAGRLLTRDAREARGDARVAEPDRGNDRGRRRRRGAAPRLREGPGRARDARRPRAQRPLARLPSGSVHVERFLRSSASRT